MIWRFGRSLTQTIDCIKLGIRQQAAAHLHEGRSHAESPSVVIKEDNVLKMTQQPCQGHSETFFNPRVILICTVILPASINSNTMRAALSRDRGSRIRLRLCCVSALPHSAPSTLEALSCSLLLPLYSLPTPSNAVLL